ncbi:hypothetical protein [Actinoallomurus sp. NPDC050550]
MSHPPAHHEGEHGEVSATYRPTDHQPEVTYGSGNTVSAPAPPPARGSV